MPDREEGGGGARLDRRLLISDDSPWSGRGGGTERSPARDSSALQSLGDDGHLLEAIFGGMLQDCRESPPPPPPPPEGAGGGEVPVGVLVEDFGAPSCSTPELADTLQDLQALFSPIFASEENISSSEDDEFCSLTDPYPSTVTELVTLEDESDADTPSSSQPSQSQLLQLSEVPAFTTGFVASPQDIPGPSSGLAPLSPEFYPSAPPLSATPPLTASTSSSSVAAPQHNSRGGRRRRTGKQTRGRGPAGGSAGGWRRSSMRRLRPYRLAEPAASAAEPRASAASTTGSPAQHQPSGPPQPVSSSSLPHQFDIIEPVEMGGSPLGQWPHGLSSMMASLACTLGLFNISRFAILSVQYGGNFVIQFVVMSLVLGIPLYTFQVSLGQLLGAGAVDMWRISPIFQGIGIALILSQALLGIYSIVGVSWMFIYFRDSFITKQDTYRWSVPYEGFQGLSWRSNSTVRLEETVANYFAGVVLQRSNLETPANAPGHLKFQVTFNLAVVWMIVFISLSKGLKSYGKVVFLFSLAPAFGMLVLCTKLVGLAPLGSKFQMGFPHTEWGEFFLNSKSWGAALSESFYTWGLLGAAAMQLSSHNRPKHLLHRDTSFVTCVTLLVLVLAAFLANTCSLLLSAYGYTYIPSSFERMSTYGFLQSRKSPLPSSLASVPQRWLPRSLLLAGERLLKPGVNSRTQSGYQTLRLATELVPATLAVLGPGKLSPFWSVLFYFVLILFGIAQQLAIMHCVITGIMAIKVKSLRFWETTITFFTCACGFILGLPMATELGIFVVYFLDYTVGGGWWIMLLYLAQLIAVFMVRGRPYSGETVVATLFSRAGRLLQDWAAPILSFTWNVILPVMLMVLCISVFKNGHYRELLRVGGSLDYDYWPSWSREVGALIQLLPLLLVPIVGVLQGCRYLSSGPPDIFDRIQLLYRPPEERLSGPAGGEEEGGPAQSDPAAAVSPPAPSPAEDPPPKYTPPPSYSTATGARIAKFMRQSFRRSVRRLQTALGSAGSGGGGTSSETGSEPPPPDYEAVLVEIQGSAALGGPTTSASLATVSEVAARLRSSFRRAIADHQSSQQSLVPNDSLILDDKRLP